AGCGLHGKTHRRPDRNASGVNRAERTSVERPVFSLGNMRVRLAASAPVAASVLLLLINGPARADEFSEVRSILDKNCLKCHGPDKQKGGLRFDTKEGAFKEGESGEKAIVPGHAGQSRLIKLVSSTDDAERMPSKGDALSV